MKKNTAALRLQRMLDIKDGKPMPRTTETSEFNQAAEANRPIGTSCHARTQQGRMYTQAEMSILRRCEQIWPGSLGYYIDSLLPSRD